jgi:hypothetical protein
MRVVKLVGNPDSAQASHAIDPGGIRRRCQFLGRHFSIGLAEDARVPIVSVHGKQISCPMITGLSPIWQRRHTPGGGFASHPQPAENLRRISHELQKRFNPVIASRLTKKDGWKPLSSRPISCTRSCSRITGRTRLHSGHDAQGKAGTSNNVRRPKSPAVHPESFRSEGGIGKIASIRTPEANA